MAALAALPNVHVKISGLDYIRHGWAVDAGANAVVKGLVREVVALFGASRCMFASNFPVDLCVLGRVWGGGGPAARRHPIHTRRATTRLTEKNLSPPSCLSRCALQLLI